MPRGDNAGRPMGRRHQDDIRAKIQAAMIVKRFQDSFTGLADMTDQQVNIGKILLNKVLPDLKAVEHSGDQENPIRAAITVKFRD